jgi:hypothetical protein
MVRPVPIVTIDFGAGPVVTRTVRGNVATYVCSPEGRVLDVLPGIYEPRTFLDLLGQLRLMFEFVKQNRHAALAEYHRRHADALTRRRVPGRFLLRRYSASAEAFFSRGVFIKYPVRTVVTLEKDQPTGGLAQIAARFSSPVKKNPFLVHLPKELPLTSIEDLSNWDALLEDTLINETLRRQAIHEKLLHLPSIKPKDIMSWLFREVLGCDIEDPCLGLAHLRSYA